MKKIYLAALGAFVTLGGLTSCGGSVSTNAKLTTENDTLSYAYGASLYNNGGLSKHLEQMGLISDTAQWGAYYRSMITAEQNPAKRDSLQKDMKTRIDSMQAANIKNIEGFLKGVQEGLASSPSDEAYMTGLSVGNQMSKQMFTFFIDQVYGDEALDTISKKRKEVNNDAFLAGLASAMEKKELEIKDPAAIVDAKTMEVQKKAQAKRDEALKGQYQDQIAAGNKFLAENKTKEGVVALPDGLQYKVVKEGTGAKPKATDVVKVNYHGTLIDGTVFDSSVQRGEPAVFGVNQVIPGWTEALQLMPVGSKWTLYVPYDLAYGAMDRGPLKPFSTLIFDVELLGIEQSGDSIQ